MRVVIAQSWNGMPLENTRHIVIELQEMAHGDLGITIQAPFHSDPAPKTPKGRLWGLWQHEVVEVFLVGETGEYTELEFGPHGHYLALQLEAPRQMTDQDIPLEYVSEIHGDRWQGRARVPARCLPRPIVAFNCFGIHGQDSERRYLAHAKLPGPRPDFHQPGHFPPWPPQNS